MNGQGKTKASPENVRMQVWVEVSAYDRWKACADKADRTLTNWVTRHLNRAAQGHRRK